MPKPLKFAPCSNFPLYNNIPESIPVHAVNLVAVGHMIFKLTGARINKKLGPLSIVTLYVMATSSSEDASKSIFTISCLGKEIRQFMQVAKEPLETRDG